jgi:hypothetical protein
VPEGHLRYAAPQPTDGACRRPPRRNHTAQLEGLESGHGEFKLHGAVLVDGSTVMLHFGFGDSSLAIAKPLDAPRVRQLGFRGLSIRRTHLLHHREECLDG